MDWKHNGVQSLLVKPIGTQDLLRQIEAMLIQQQDANQSDEPGHVTRDNGAEASKRKAS
jgi:DNA-binding response OmpR family regulator